MSPDRPADRFHACALLAGFLARRRGFLADSERVRRLAYRLYERGAFRGGAAADPLAAAVERTGESGP